jgi:hypothetical protein
MHQLIIKITDHHSFLLNIALICTLIHLVAIHIIFNIPIEGISRFGLGFHFN